MHHRQFHQLTRPRCVERCGLLSTKRFVCGEPWAEEGIALLEKAAGQGHACAMDALHDIFLNRHEYVQAVGWMTKAAEAGLPAAKAALPDALFNLVGRCRLTVSKPVLKEHMVSALEVII